ncbi:hypothetical protein GCM10020367_60950 [Streptomyces sannanensis]|uniref:Uncharacterized protein n=1 Tax=Streptomyces sannanensis TaxID=285536 RepID=A0ABP6SKJ8_9ACTN
MRGTFHPFAPGPARSATHDPSVGGAARGRPRGGVRGPGGGSAGGGGRARLTGKAGRAVRLTRPSVTARLALGRMEGSRRVARAGGGSAAYRFLPWLMAGGSADA